MIRALAAAALLALAGCATDICGHRAEIGQACDHPMSDTELSACDEALATCSGDERQRLKTLYQCLEKQGYDTCDEGGDFAGPSANQLEALLACDQATRGISASCLEAAGRTPLTTF